MGQGIVAKPCRPPNTKKFVDSETVKFGKIVVGRRYSRWRVAHDPEKWEPVFRPTRKPFGAGEVGRIRSCADKKSEIGVVSRPKPGRKPHERQAEYR